MCPPAEACRDAFLRMSKATIAMVEKTTGFGNASTLGSQPLSSPVSYFGRHDSLPRRTSNTDPEHPRPPKRKWTMPKFDMNLKDLFSEVEISNRPLMHQTKLQKFGQQSTFGSASINLPTQTSDPTQSSSFPLSNSPGSFTSAPPQHFTLTNQQPYVPQLDTMSQSQSQSDFSFDDMSFLDTFTTSDATARDWGGWSGSTGDLDLGFGTGGMSSNDSNGNFDPSGVDMFGGFFFGGNDGTGF